MLITGWSLAKTAIDAHLGSYDVRQMLIYAAAHFVDPFLTYDYDADAEDDADADTPEDDTTRVHNSINDLDDEVGGVE